MFLLLGLVNPGLNSSEGGSLIYVSIIYCLL